MKLYGTFIGLTLVRLQAKYQSICAVEMAVVETLRTIHSDIVNKPQTIGKQWKLSKIIQMHFDSVFRIRYDNPMDRHR